jgi:hypothetical protein
MSDVPNPRLPRWMLEVEADQIQDQLDEARAIRDGMRLASAPTKRGINRRIDRLEARETELRRLLWDTNGVKCRVAECQERVDEHDTFTQMGLCIEHYAFATGASDTPPPSPSVPPISHGSPWGDTNTD